MLTDNLLQTQLIAWKRIECDTPEEIYEPAQIKALAESIEAVGTVLMPLVVTRQGLDQFKLVLDPLFYYAAGQFRKKHPLMGENILVFIADDSQVQALQNQYITLLGQAGLGVSSTVEAVDGAQVLNSLRSFNETLNSGLLTQQKALFDLTQQLKPLPKRDSHQLLLADLNTLTVQELGHKLKRLRLEKQNKTLDKLLAKFEEMRQKQQPKQIFDDLSDVVKCKALSANKVLFYLQHWE
jgi:hypothetical protein